jgi:hypothetical protein
MSSNTERANPKAPSFVALGETLIARLLILALRHQEREHDHALASHPMFSRAHWEHHAGADWPEEPDDDSYTAFQNCIHPDCVLVREAAEALSSPREGAVILTPTQIDKEEEDESRGGTQAVSEHGDLPRRSEGDS